MLDRYPGTNGNGARGSDENCSQGEMFTRDGCERSFIVVVTLLLSLSRMPEHQFFLVLRFIFIDRQNVEYAYCTDSRNFSDWAR
jgi:hypothetical protein